MDKLGSVRNPKPNSLWADIEQLIPSWEFLILLAVMVTIFGIVNNRSLQRIPDQSSRQRFEQIDRDPYDIRPERSLSDSRNLVEMGL